MNCLLWRNLWWLLKVLIVASFLHVGRQRSMARWRRVTPSDTVYLSLLSLLLWSSCAYSGEKLGHGVEGKVQRWGNQQILGYMPWVPWTGDTQQPLPRSKQLVAMEGRTWLMFLPEGRGHTFWGVTSMWHLNCVLGTGTCKPHPMFSVRQSCPPACSDLLEPLDREQPHNIMVYLGGFEAGAAVGSQRASFDVWFCSCFPLDSGQRS